MFYKIISDDTIEGKILIPPGLINNFRLYKNNFKTLKFGQCKIDVTIIEDESLDKNVVKISIDIIDYLGMPTDLKYQIRLDNGTIHFGIIIGLLVTAKKKSITKQKIIKLNSYLVLYSRIQGMIFAFSEEGIDKNTQRVEGIYFSPSENNWLTAKIPYPDVIYRRTPIGNDTLEHLKEVTQNRIFNSDYFDKWDFWKLVEQNRTIMEYIPDTCRFTDFDNLESMLKTYKAVLLKPAFGTMGIGIIQITKNIETYTVNSKNGEELLQTDSKEVLLNFIKKKTKSKSYLIQQFIDSMKYENRIPCLRVIMQKGFTQKWQCTGIIAILGQENGITSNRGYAITFENFLRKLLNNNQSEIYKIRERITYACMILCKELDCSGNYGDLGIDVVLDSNMKLWILEVNKKHDHSLLRVIGEDLLYYSVKANPIKYATGLSGFALLSSNISVDINPNTKYPDDMRSQE